MFGILGGSAIVGLGVRRLLGPSLIQRFKDQIDGFNILILFVFVAAVMEDVARSIVAKPALMLLGFILFGASLP